MAKKKNGPGRPIKKDSERRQPISFRVDPSIIKELEKRVNGVKNSAGGQKSIQEFAREIFVEAVEKSKKS